MAEQLPLVKVITDAIEVLPPSTQRQPQIVVNVHNYLAPQPQAKDQRQADDWAKVIVGGIFAIAATIAGPIALEIYKANSSPIPYNPPPVQRTSQHCWWEPRRQFLGSELAYDETTRFYEGYGRWRVVVRHHYVNRYRNYSIKVCS